MAFKTIELIQNIKTVNATDETTVNTLLNTILNTFLKDLNYFNIRNTSIDNFTKGKLICETLEAYTILRNHILQVIDWYTQLHSIASTIESWITFLEQLPTIEQTSKTEGEIYKHYSIIIHELFLYLITIGLKNENFRFVAHLLHAPYNFQDTTTPKSFTKLFRNANIIREYYEKQYAQKFTKPMADSIIKRRPENITTYHIVEADLLCHYVAELNHQKWFPKTYIYDSHSEKTLFSNLNSQQHFNNTKALYNVTTVNQLENQLKTLKEKDEQDVAVGFSGSFHILYKAYQIIPVNTLATIT